MRKGIGKGMGSGWKNMMSNDSMRHGLASKGIKSAQKIPILTGVLGNAQPKSEALIYRFYVKPKKGGDASFYESKDYEKLKDIRKSVIAKGDVFAEPIIGVFKKKLAKFPTQEYWEARLK